MMLFKRKDKYRVLIEGTNWIMDLNGIERFGFFTTRYVESIDRDEASEFALDLIRNELNSTGALLNKLDDPPVATVVEVVQIKSFRGMEVPGKGFTFFPDEGVSKVGGGTTCKASDIVY